MDIPSFIRGFRKIAGPNLPTSVEKMFAHQEKPVQDHPIFGRLAPQGIDGWETQYSTEFTFDGKVRKLSIDYFVQEPDLIVFQENFVELSDAMEGIVSQFLTFLSEEPNPAPDDWDDLFLDFAVADIPYSTGLRWRGGGHGGGASSEYQLFFEGMELKGIVPIWNDPVCKGFEDW